MGPIMGRPDGKARWEGPMGGPDGPDHGKARWEGPIMGRPDGRARWEGPMGRPDGKAPILVHMSLDALLPSNHSS
jgi:hypothetical protein